MAIEVSYRAEATAWGGRSGRAASSDGKLELALSVPKEMGGDGGPGTNPEQLFAVGYAACFQQAVMAVARKSDVDVADSAITVRVGIGSDAERGGFGLEVEIAGEFPGIDPATARQILEQAHEMCPYSRATRNNIAVSLVVVEG